MERMTDWRDRALCADAVTTPEDDIWFSDKPADIAEAKRICGNCPVANSCMFEGVGREGVWGGIVSRQSRHGTSIRPNDPLDVAITRLHAEGLLDTHIAPKVGLTASQVRTWRRVRGVPSNRKAADYTERQARYEAGLTDAEIAELEGNTVGAVKAWRQSRGMPSNYVRGVA